MGLRLVNKYISLFIKYWLFAQLLNYRVMRSDAVSSLFRFPGNIYALSLFSFLICFCLEQSLSKFDYQNVCSLMVIELN